MLVCCLPSPTESHRSWPTWVPHMRQTPLIPALAFGKLQKGSTKPYEGCTTPLLGLAVGGLAELKSLVNMFRPWSRAIPCATEALESPPCEADRDSSIPWPSLQVSQPCEPSGKRSWQKRALGLKCHWNSRCNLISDMKPGTVQCTAQGLIRQRVRDWGPDRGASKHRELDSQQ